MLPRVLQAFKTLERNPVPAREYQVKKVEGREDTYRIRLSSFRIVYTVFWQEGVIRIAKVERKSDNTYD